MMLATVAGAIVGMTHALVATSSAPADWAYGTAAAALFVAAIVVPAALLNARDHRRWKAERDARARAGTASSPGSVSAP